MFYFRLNKVVIFDNGAIKSFLGLFGQDFSDVKFLSFITPSDIELPALDDFIRATDPAARAALLARAVKSVIASRELTEVSRITDHAKITFGDTGYVLYESEAIPESFNWTFLAIKSNRGFREKGEHIREILKDPKFGEFSDGLFSTLKGGAAAANPAFAAAAALAKFAAQVAAQNMARKGDQQLGLIYMSLNRAEHYPHGERKADDVTDLTNNMRFDYSIFAFEKGVPVARERRSAASRRR